MGSHALSPLLKAIKARVTALYQHDGRLYAGCADGSVRVYQLGAGDSTATSASASGTTTPVKPDSEVLASELSLLATYQLSKREITQLSVLTEAKQLVVLSGKSISESPSDARLCRNALLSREPHCKGFEYGTIPSANSPRHCDDDILCPVRD